MRKIIGGWLEVEDDAKALVLQCDNGDEIANGLTDEEFAEYQEAGIQVYYPKRIEL